MCLALARAPIAAAQQPQIAVSNDQLVTLSGSSPSLRDVVQQLCAASGVELRQYGAEDRPFAGTYEGVPLSELLPRLLRSESYAAGLRSTDGGKNGARIAWVRVIGHSGTPLQPYLPPVPPAVAADEPREPEHKTDVEVAPNEATNLVTLLLNPAFTTDSEESRKQHIANIVENFAESPEAKTTLERANPAAIARKLAEFPDARGVFAMIQSTVQDPDLARRLDMIGDSLDAAIMANINNSQ